MSKEGMKFDQDKLRYDLLPKGTIQEVIRVLMFGSKKYADNNWQEVNDWKKRYYNAAKRHLTDEWWDKGSQHDPEHGYHPLASVVCCCLFLMWFEFKEARNEKRRNKTRIPRKNKKVTKKKKRGATTKKSTNI